MITPSFVRCNAVNVTSTSGWTSEDLLLSLGGQTYNQLGLISRIGFPVLRVTSPVSLSVDGGQELTIVGENLGALQEHVGSIQIGGRPCIDPVLESSSTVRCTSPAGVGSVGVHYMQAGGRTVTATGILAYDEPELVSITPNYALFGDIDYDFVISGASLGVLPLDLPSLVSIGGYECPNVTLFNSTTARCSGLSGSSGWLSSDVSVEVGGRRARRADLLETFGPPRVVAAFPDVGNTSGGYWIEIATEQQGTQLSDVRQITIGGRPCTEIAWGGTGAMRCKVPAGVGRQHRIVVENAGGTVTTDNVLFSYERPSVTGVGPARVMTGPTSYNVTITGNSIALPPGASGAVGGNGVPTVTVGGNPCEDGVVVVSASVVECRGLSAASWQSDTVHLVLDGQETRVAGLFRAVQPPAVTRLDPSQGPTKGNWTVSVFGTGFGDSASDVSGITIGGRACSNLTFVSSTELACRVPAGTGRSLDVIVTNAVGRQSQAVPLMSYDPPVVLAADPNYYLTAVAGADPVSVRLTGTSIASGDPSDPVPVVRVGGVQCTAVDIVSTEEVYCSGLDPSAWTSNTAVLALGGQLGQSQSAFRYYGRPAVLAVDPAIGAAQEGGTELNIIGASLGFAQSDVKQVTIGGEECADVDLISSDRLRCIAPRHFGQGLDVVVTNALNLSSVPLPVFSYKGPEIVGTTPGYTFEIAPELDGSGELLEFNVTGLGFGHSRAAVASVSVGGELCPRVDWISPQVLRCIGLRMTQWASSVVQVMLSSNQTVAVPLLRRYGAPRVTAVQPGSSGVTGGAR